MEVWMLILAVWIVCGVLAFGLTLGYLLREFAHLVYLAAFKERFPHLRGGPRRTVAEDVGFSLLGFLFGPIWLVVVFFLSDHAKHGLKYRWWVEEPYRS